MTLRKNILPTSHYQKFNSEMLEPRKKEKELVGKSNISNLVKKIDLNSQLKSKIKLE